MEEFPIKIEECPDYILPVQAPDEEKAEQIAKNLFNKYSKEYFIRNGSKVEKKENV